MIVDGNHHDLGGGDPDRPLKVRAALRLKTAQDRSTSLNQQLLALNAELEVNLKDAYRLLVMDDVPEEYQTKAITV